MPCTVGSAGSAWKFPSRAENTSMHVYVCLCMCVCTCARVCVYVCVCVCVGDCLFTPNIASHPSSKHCNLASINLSLPVHPSSLLPWHCVLCLCLHTYHLHARLHTAPALMTCVCERTGSNVTSPQIHTCASGKHTHQPPSLSAHLYSLFKTPKSHLPSLAAQHS